MFIAYAVDSYGDQFRLELTKTSKDVRRKVKRYIAKTGDLHLISLKQDIQISNLSTKGQLLIEHANDGGYYFCLQDDVPEAQHRDIQQHKILYIRILWDCSFSRYKSVTPSLDLLRDIVQKFKDVDLEIVTFSNAIISKDRFQGEAYLLNRFTDSMQ